MFSKSKRIRNNNNNVDLCDFANNLAKLITNACGVDEANENGFLINLKNGIIENDELSHNAEHAAKFIQWCVDISADAKDIGEKEAWANAVLDVIKKIPVIAQKVDEKKLVKKQNPIIKMMDDVPDKVAKEQLLAKDAALMKYFGWALGISESDQRKVLSGYKAFVEKHGKYIRPDSVAMIHFINSQKGNKFNKNNDESVSQHFYFLLTDILRYVKEVLIKDPSFADHHSPEKLADATRFQSYPICYYDKKHKLIEQITVYAPSYQSLKVLDDIREAIMNHALQPENFNKIFKTADDMKLCIEMLRKDNTTVPLGLVSLGIDPALKKNQQMVKLLEAAILASPRMMKQIANHKDAETFFYKQMPAIEGKCRAAVAYSHAAKGLLFVRKYTESSKVKQALPKEIIKKIAGQVKEAANQDNEKNDHGKKNR